MEPAEAIRVSSKVYNILVARGFGVWKNYTPSTKSAFIFKSCLKRSHFVVQVATSRASGNKYGYSCHVGRVLREAENIVTVVCSETAVCVIC